MASYYGNGKRARGRAATCPCEKTIRARGEDSLSLGTHDAQTSCLLTEAFTRWNTAEGGYGRLHLGPMCIFFHTTDYRILGVSIHVYIGVSRGPQAL